MVALPNAWRHHDQEIHDKLISDLLHHSFEPISKHLILY